MSAPDMNPYRDEPDGSYCEGCSENQPWTSACPACGAAMCDECERSIGCAHCEQHGAPARVYRSGRYWAMEVERTIHDEASPAYDVVGEHSAATFCDLLLETEHDGEVSILVWERWQELRDAQYGKAVPA